MKAGANLRKRFVIAAIVIALVGWAGQVVAVRAVARYWNLQEVEKLKPGPPTVPAGICAEPIYEE
jgi:hypothetical protein